MLLSEQLAHHFATYIDLTSVRWLVASIGNNDNRYSAAQWMTSVTSILIWLFSSGQKPWFPLRLMTAISVSRRNTMIGNDVLSNAECPTQGKELSKYERIAAKKWKMKMSNKICVHCRLHGEFCIVNIKWFKDRIRLEFLITFYSIMTEVVRLRYEC